MAQLSQIPQIKNGKPDFSPTFQKVELHNSTFFQLHYCFFVFFCIWNDLCVQNQLEKLREEKED